MFDEYGLPTWPALLVLWVASAAGLAVSVRGLVRGGQDG